MNIMKYKVLAEEDINELENKVNTMIADGWEPIGGISVSSEITGDEDDLETELVYHQSMIKRN